MKIGILIDENYPDIHNITKCIDTIQEFYKSFDNIKGKHKEPIEILTSLNNNSDCVMAIKAEKVNFKVSHRYSMEEIITESDKVYLFLKNSYSKISIYINTLVKYKTNFEVHFPIEEDTNG